MGSEQSKQIAAIEHFDRELDSLMPPVTKEALKVAAKNLLKDLFEYNATEADARVEMLEKQNYIPTDNEIDNDQGCLAEHLKIGLFSSIPQDYIITYGRQEFDQWIGRYLRSILQGHTSWSPSYEHDNECPEERLCSSLVMSRMVRGNLCDELTTIRGNEEYLVYTDDIIYMNIKIVREMVALGIYDEVDSAKILKKYMQRLDMIEVDGYPLAYDESLFETPKTQAV